MAPDPQTPPSEGPVPADDPFLGRTLGGHYRVEARIGRGAMGAVYHARHTLLEQDHAVKVLHPELTEDPEVRRRFLLEARSLTAFTHKHAVQVRHCGEEAGQLYIVMDLVAGESLAARLAREGALPCRSAAAIAVQVLEALEEAHAAGIVHRDVKPANILVERVARADGSSEERARVVDFGLARWVGPHADAHGSALVSQGGRVVGTVAYMAPEQLRCDEVDGRADLFGVGAVLYEALTGERPFPGESLLSAAARVLADPPRAWSALELEQVPEAVRAVVARALEKDPDRRFQSAGAMAEALRGALAGVATPDASLPPAPPAFPAPLTFQAGAATLSTPVSLPPIAPTPRRRGVLVVGGVLALAGLLWALGVGRASPAERSRAERDAGRAALVHGRYEEAHAAFQRALKAVPEDAEALLGRAEARVALGDRGAAADLDAAARLAPKDVRVHLLRARMLEQVEQDVPAAIEELGRALWLDLHSAEVRVARATLALVKQDLELAEGDVAALEASAPDDPRGPALRARLRSLRCNDLPPDGRRACLEEALAAAQRAVDADARWAGGPQALGMVHTALAIHLRALAEDGAAGEHAQRALDAADEAVRRATQDPTRLQQGRELARYYADRAGAAFVAGDSARALPDLDRAVDLAPRDAGLLSMRAFHLQQAGEHERAFADYEKLYAITQQSDPLFRLGFGVHLIGDAEHDRGELEAARRHYLRAEATYTRGLSRFPDVVDLRLYRGEVRTRLARLAAGAAERTDLLAQARADFEHILTRHPEDPTWVERQSETLLRRGELALVEERPAEALQDLGRAVGDRQDRTPRYFLRLAQAALACAQVEPIPPGVGPPAGLLEDALAALERASVLAGGRHIPAASLRVQVRVEQARRADAPDERARHLASAREAQGTLAGWGEVPADADPQALEAGHRARAAAGHAQALIRDLEGDAPGALAALREALALREAERRAGRWLLEPTWYELFARLCEAQGLSAQATQAREQAARLPR